MVAERAVMRRAARIVLFLAALAALAPAFAQDKTFLWEVQGAGNRLYLFGTVHAGKKEWYPLPEAVEKAFRESQVVVVEADVSDTATMARYAKSMTYLPPASLRTHVPAADYVRFQALLPRYGLSETEIVRMKPFMAVSLLVFAEWARQGLHAQFGTESYLLQRARAENKRILEIEGVETQMKLMDSLTDRETLDLFSGTLTALETGLAAEQINGLIGAWQRGDPDAMLAIARGYNARVKGAAEFEEKFVWSRHDAMVAKIEGYLSGSRERHFVAVGSLHLAGPRGLVEMLRKRGYVVRQR